MPITTNLPRVSLEFWQRIDLALTNLDTCMGARPPDAERIETSSAYVERLAAALKEAGAAIAAARLKNDVIDPNSWTTGSLPERWARSMFQLGFDPSLTSDRLAEWLGQINGDGERPAGDPVFFDLMRSSLSDFAMAIRQTTRPQQPLAPGGPSSPNEFPHPVFQIGDQKTLPLYLVQGRTKTEIPAFGKGQMAIEYSDPEYSTVRYSVDLASVNQISNNADIAADFVRAWKEHLSAFLYYAQFRDDSDHTKIRAFDAHTRLVSTLCDSRLAIDTTELWTTFDDVRRFSLIHCDYREDPKREEKYREYARRLADAWTCVSPHMAATTRLIGRIVTQIELRTANWSNLGAISRTEEHVLTNLGTGNKATQARVKLPVEVFFSYSHKDEKLRDKLDKHFTLLKREGLISGWHDRKIGPGTEWKGQIDEHLNSAGIILLLVTADFVASDYCYDVEARRAIERHEAGDARVVPIILRPCDWHNAPFGKLQALPKDAKPVVDWKSRDHAFNDVARGLRAVVNELMMLIDTKQSC